LDAVEVVGGRQVGEIYEGERRFPLQVRLPAELREDIEALSSLPVRGSGPSVPLAQIAELRWLDSPALVNRLGARRRTVVEMNVRGRDLATFVGEASARVEAEVPMPPGYVLRWGGQHEQLREASARLALIVPVALGLIFMLLYLAFGA